MRRAHLPVCCLLLVTAMAAASKKSPPATKTFEEKEQIAIEMKKIS